MPPRGPTKPLAPNNPRVHQTRDDSLASDPPPTVSRTADRFKVEVTNRSDGYVDGVTVVANSVACEAADSTRVDAGGSLQFSCKIPKDPKTIALVASAHGGHSAGATVSLAYEELLCPDYSNILEAQPGAVGKATVQEIASRWNATIDALAVLGCDIDVSVFRLPESGTFNAVDLKDGAVPIGDVVFEMDDTSERTVREMQIALYARGQIFRADLMFLIASVATDNARDAVTIQPPVLADQITTLPPTTLGGAKPVVTLFDFCEGGDGSQATSDINGSTENVTITKC